MLQYKGQTDSKVSCRIAKLHFLPHDKVNMSENRTVRNVAGGLFVLCLTKVIIPYSTSNVDAVVGNEED